MTDQRREPRREERLSVELTHDGQYLGRFTTRDTCVHGAFVEAPSTGLGTGDAVTVSFVAVRSVALRRIRLAHVAHVSDRGIGVSYAAPAASADSLDVSGARSRRGR